MKQSMEKTKNQSQILDDFLVTLAKELGIIKLLDWLSDKLNKWTTIRQKKS